MKFYHLLNQFSFALLSLLMVAIPISYAADNTPPIADAGHHQTTGFSTVVTLDGSHSFDSDGRIKTYQWQQIQGQKVILSNAITAKPFFKIPAKIKIQQPLTLVFKLTVTDNQNKSASDTVIVTAITNKLNDTGITSCANATQNGLTCPRAGYPGQDAQFGRDNTLNTPKDGHAGFSYTKISTTGTILPANAKSWHCVKDNVTGLVWEIKTNDNGLHDKDWTYSWYDPIKTQNGGSSGIKDGGWCGETSLCDTDAYVKMVNAQSWCGAKNWRLPSKRELRTLINYNKIPFVLDRAYFPNTLDDKAYWSSTPDAYETHLAWCIIFNHINTIVIDKGSKLPVRLVRQEE